MGGSANPISTGWGAGGGSANPISTGGGVSGGSANEIKCSGSDQSVSQTAQGKIPGARMRMLRPDPNTNGSYNL